MPKISSFVRLISVLAAAAAACLSLADRASAEPGPPNRDAPPVVTVLKVPVKDVNPAVEYVGRIEAMFFATR